MVDREYWRTLQGHPLSPSESDLEVYKGMLVPGSVLLLGCTHRLIPISVAQLDIDPWHSGPSVIVGDWRCNTTRYDNMIGDGVLNLGKELCDGVVEMASRNCSRLVVRSFNAKLEGMKVASHFPQPIDLPIRPSWHLNMGDYSFYAWSFS